MTKKDFELIARTISDVRQFRFAAACGVSDTTPTGSRPRTCDTIARLFAERLANTNPRFDRARFLAACGVPNGEG